MEFNATGLPQDPTVFKAYKMYADNLSSLPKQYQDGYPLRVAQVLNKATNGDSKMITLALLNIMPPDTHGIIEKRFGADVTALLVESLRHIKTGYAHLEHASPAIRKLCAASAIVSFAEFEKMAEKTYEAIEKMAQGELPQSGVPVATVPDTSIYDRIGSLLQGQAPELESLYAEKLADFKAFNAEHTQRLEAAGFGKPRADIPDMAKFRYPTFEEVGLPDNPKIRTAYDIITHDKRMLPEDFEASIEVTRILTGLVPSPNPTTIAAGLIDVGLRLRTQQDLDVYKDKLDWDVLEVLTANSVYATQTPSSLMKSPVEFRQIAFAHMITLVDGALMSGEVIMQAMSLDKSIPKSFLIQNLEPMGMTVLTAEKEILSARGTTDAPELEKALDMMTKKLRRFVVDNIPDDMKAQNNKNKPKPGGPGL